MGQLRRKAVSPHLGVAPWHATDASSSYLGTWAQGVAVVRFRMCPTTGWGGPALPTASNNRTLCLSPAHRLPGGLLRPIPSCLREPDPEARRGRGTPGAAR